MTEVRAARPEELDRVAAMWSAMYAFQQAAGMVLPQREDAEEIWKRENASRLDSALATVLVAVQGDALVGFLAAQTKRLPPYLATGNPKIGYISAVYVDPAARRGRIGHALVDAALAWFARAEVSSIELQVIAGNETAREFWTSVGFAPEILQMRRLT